MDIMIRDVDDDIHFGVSGFRVDRFVTYTDCPGDGEEGGSAGWAGKLSSKSMRAIRGVIGSSWRFTGDEISRSRMRGQAGRGERQSEGISITRLTGDRGAGRACARSHIGPAVRCPNPLTRSRMARLFRRKFLGSRAQASSKRGDDRMIFARALPGHY